MLLLKKCVKIDKFLQCRLANPVPCDFFFHLLYLQIVGIVVLNAEFKV